MVQQSDYKGLTVACKEVAVKWLPYVAVTNYEPPLGREVRE